MKDKCPGSSREPAIDKIWFTDENGIVLHEWNVESDRSEPPNDQHTITFDFNNTEYINKVREKNLAFIKKMSESCMWFFPDRTYTNGWCSKCNCALIACKSYKKP